MSASGSACWLQFFSHRFSKISAAQIAPKYSVKIGAIMIKVVTVVENGLIHRVGLLVEEVRIDLREGGQSLFWLLPERLVHRVAPEPEPPRRASARIGSSVCRRCP